MWSPYVTIGGELCASDGCIFEEINIVVSVDRQSPPCRKSHQSQVCVFVTDYFDHVGCVVLWDVILCP